MMLPSIRWAKEYRDAWNVLIVTPKRRWITVAKAVCGFCLWPWAQHTESERQSCEADLRAIEQREEAELWRTIEAGLFVFDLCWLWGHDLTAPTLRLV